jgi:hypothetical protein
MVCEKVPNTHLCMLSEFSIFENLPYIRMNAGLVEIAGSAIIQDECLLGLNDRPTNISNELSSRRFTVIQESLY